MILLMVQEYSCNYTNQSDDRCNEEAVGFNCTWYYLSAPDKIQFEIKMSHKSK